MATPGGNDYEALARQYWDFWTDAMQRTTGTASSAGDAASASDRQPAGAGSGAGAEGFNAEAFDVLGQQARAWYGQMQQLAARFANRPADPHQIAETWRQMLGGAPGMGFGPALGGFAGGDVLGETMRRFQMPGQQGFDAWYRQVAPFLQGLGQGLPAEAWQRESRAWLGMPAFGFAREHQERWQKLAQAHLDYLEQTRAYQTLLGEATQDAFGRFERKLAERGEADKPVTSARALFDLWIDGAEEAYAEVALSPRFRDAYGRFVNAQMRLRAAVQKEIEQLSSHFGMPTRTEMDAAHRKITQLERELRRMRDTLKAGAGRMRDADQGAQPAARAAEPAREAAKPSRANGEGGGKNNGKNDGKAPAKAGAKKKRAG